MRRDSDWLLLLADSERRRVNTLLGVVAAMAAFVWLELGRRLGIVQAEGAARTEYVDGRIEALSDEQLGHAGRSQGVSSVFKAAAVVATSSAALIAIFATLFATHVL